MSKSRRRRVMQLALHQDGDGGCFYCGEAMFFLDPGIHYEGNGEIEQSPDVASEDHVVPIDLGGTRHLSNVVIAHRGCNSVKGNSAPTPAMLERLVTLNERRGLTPPAVPGTMSADTFLARGETTPALYYLCDLLNAISGRDGVRQRAKFGRRMEKLLDTRRSLRSVTDDARRIWFMQLAFADISKNRLFADDTLQGLMDNVTAGIIKREKQLVEERRVAERHARRAERSVARRLKKEAVEPL